MTRFLLVSDDAAFERRVDLAFGGNLNGDLQRIDPSAVDGLRANGGAPEVLVLGPGLAAETGLGIAERFDLERPDVSVVMVAADDPDLWSRAMRAGVCDVLDADAADPEIRDVLRRASDISLRRRQAFSGDGQRSQRGRVVSVISPRGGSGKTTVATNLAVGLAPTAPGEVVLVDADLQFGDAATMLQLVSEHTLAEAAPATATGDPMALKVYLTAHPSDLFVLCAPETPADGERITGEQVAQVIHLLASEFRYVIVDTGAGVHPASLAAADEATDLLLLASMDVPSIRGVTTILGALDAAGAASQRRHFVLNRADSRVGLDVEEVAATVGLPVDVALPSSRHVPVAVNSGVPVLLSAPRTPIGRQLQSLVDRFVEQPAEQSSGRRFSLRSGS